MSRARILLGALWLIGCSGEDIVAGSSEPLFVRGAQFRDGKLPGLAPLTAAEVTAGVMPKTPSIAGIEANGLTISPGRAQKSFSGRVTSDAVALGVRLEEAGSGYFVLPAGIADPVNEGQLQWSLQADFAHGVKPGKHVLLFAALGADGRAGHQSSLPLCLLPEIPDNGNACNESKAPPALVVSLGWDAPVDLDLRVITPSGKTVDSKHPSTALPNDEGVVDPSAPGVGIIDADSNSHCIADGKQRENLIFPIKPEPGRYLVYVNLYDACGQPSVRFRASLQSATFGEEEGTFGVSENFTQGGELLALQQNGGQKLGLFVTSFTVN